MNENTDTTPAKPASACACCACAPCTCIDRQCCDCGEQAGGSCGCNGA